MPIFGDYYPVSAEVRVLNSFSGHADYNEIMAFVRTLDKERLKKIFLVHGEKDAQQNLNKLMIESGYATQIIKAGERYALART